MSDLWKRLATSPDLSARNREFDIDPFRGMVCLSLVMLHYWQAGAIQQRVDELLGYGGQIAIQHLRFGVESFFVLAGVMMAHMLRPVPGQEISLPSYLLRRFRRLMLPYGIAVLVAAADLWLAYGMTSSARTPPGAGELLSQLTLTQGFFQLPDAAVGYWSLVSLEQFYVLILALYGLCWMVCGRSEQRHGSAEVLLSWLALLIALASAALLLVKIRTGFSTGLELSTWALYIAIGMLLYWAVQLGFGRWQLVIALSALAVVAVLAWSSPPFRSRPIAGLLSVLVLFALLRGWRMPAWRPVEWLRYCGERSYSIYLMHGIVGIRVLSLAKALPEGRWLTAAALLTAFAAAFLAAEVFFRLVELPCQQWARQVQYRRHAARSCIKPLAAGTTRPGAQLPCICDCR